MPETTAPTSPSAPVVRPRTALLGVGEVDWDAPLVGVDDLGLTRGDGCFETLRVVGGPPRRLLQLQAHLDRFARSARTLELEAPDLQAWAALALAVADEVPAGAEAALRLSLTRGRPGAGPTGIATLRPVGPETTRPRVDGCRVVTLTRGTPAQVHAAAPWLLGGAKTLSYAVHTAALREAARRGAGDALFTSTDGFVLEGPTATLVWLAGDELLTTPTDGTGILEGTTQLAIFAGARAAGTPTAVRPVTVAQVQDADAAWLVSSVRGAVEITHLDDVELPRRPEVTARLREWAQA